MPRRYLAYMAGRSTPVFLKVIQEMVAQLGDQIEVFDLVIGDRYNYQRARQQSMDPRIQLTYQHEDIDPFRRPTRPDYRRLAHHEDRYGLPHLQQYILSHRLIDFLDHDQKLAYLQTYLDYYESLWERTRPEVLVSGGQDSLLFLMANAVFKRNGAIPLIMIPGRIPGRFLVVDNHLELIPHLRETFEAMKGQDLGEAAAAVQEVRRGFVERRMHLAAFGLGHQVKALPSPRRFFRNLAHRCRYQDWFFDHRPLDDIRRSALIRLRWPFHQVDIRRLMTSRVPAGKFFFYPLHYEPEATIDVQGTIYRDQWHIIKRVSAALPAGHTLCVKEHPNMFPGLRPVGFYRNLARLGNVILISSSIDSHELIARTQGVITIAGTAGFEALFYGRPVLMFGRSFYEDFREGVWRAGSFENTAAVLRRMAEGVPIRATEVDRFVAAVLRRSYVGIEELPAAGINDPANHAALARGLISELHFRMTGAA